MPNVSRIELELLLLQKSTFTGFYFWFYPERDLTEMFLLIKRLIMEGIVLWGEV